MELKIALLQLLPRGDTAAQEAAGIDACRRAKALGADIALFPEMWSCGYEIPQRPDELGAMAVDADGAFVRRFGTLAGELDMAVAVTFLERHDPLPRNSVVVFDRHGQEVLRYSKVHTYDFGDERMLSHGGDFPVAALDTAVGRVMIGCMICYDREFPESARILMLRGAEVLLVPNACPMEINRLSELRARAYENMVAVATCNYPEGKPDCNGRSTLFDGVAYDRTSPLSRDMLVLEAPGDEGIYLGGIDLDALRRFRASEVHGNAYRRPELYSPLVSDEKHAPFLRDDFRP